MDTTLIQRDTAYILHLKMIEEVEDESKPIVSIGINNENKEFYWHRDFNTTVEKMCRELSKHPKVQYIAVVNTEAEIYKDGQLQGFSRPVIVRVEITTEQDTIIYLN